jgi:hypothetical protein
MAEHDFPKLQKDAFKVGSLLGPKDDKEYWLAKSPRERMEALEIMRQIIYGYDPSALRLQRVFETAQRA